MRIVKKHMTMIILILVVFVLVIFGNLFLNYERDIICVEEKKCFSIEIVETAEERARGLSNRISLEEERGMFFIFEDETVPGFWMKDMNFPLDLLWIDRDLMIVGIEENIFPCGAESCEVYRPREKIQYVLEVSSGLSEKYRFREGDRLFLK